MSAFLKPIHPFFCAHDLVRAPGTQTYICPRCDNRVFDGTQDWHQREYHQAKAKNIKYPDGECINIDRTPPPGTFCRRCDKLYDNASAIRRHAENCNAISEQEIPIDPDEPAPGARPFANESLRGRTASFDPSQRDPLPASSPPILPIPSARDAAQQEADVKVDLKDYYLSPGPLTIVSHTAINLPACGLVIDSHHRVCMCIDCGIAVLPKRISAHVRSHGLKVDLAPAEVNLLLEEFGLITDFSHLPHPRDSPVPIFGLALSEKLYYFCNHCGHGYCSRAVLRSHRRSPRCNHPPDAVNVDIVGYAQAFTRGKYEAYFHVDPRKLQLRAHNDPSPAQLYKCSVRPLFDYSTMQIKGPQRDLDLNSFARSEDWFAVLEETGLTSAEVQEVIRGSTEDDGDLHDIKDLVIRYFADVQPMIKQHCAFGFQRLMANVGLNQHSLAAFNILTEV
ncbi:C2H2-type domain-containing protein [Mycena venus]|uniref:C2H2-type domain-containing protein n=1 Tax=Mycena venus TaxID=2733690 RepID=A0A8H6Z4Z5_9AGAR|nr:C2H2-type domain-containing protein [Mycena venus]